MKDVGMETEVTEERSESVKDEEWWTLQGETSNNTTTTIIKLRSHFNIIIEGKISPYTTNLRQ